MLNEELLKNIHSDNQIYMIYQTQQSIFITGFVARVLIDEWIEQDDYTIIELSFVELKQDKNLRILYKKYNKLFMYISFKMPKHIIQQYQLFSVSQNHNFKKRFERITFYYPTFLIRGCTPNTLKYRVYDWYHTYLYNIICNHPC